MVFVSWFLMQVYLTFLWRAMFSLGSRVWAHLVRLKKDLIALLLIQVGSIFSLMPLLRILLLLPRTIILFYFVDILRFDQLMFNVGFVLRIRGNSNPVLTSLCNI